MAGRRTSLASLAGAKVDDVPGKSDPLLLTLALDKMVPTRFNPRRNFNEQSLLEFGLVLKNRQLQPAVVVSRTGYLKLWPDEAENVGDAPYVIANGERRYRASMAAGLPTLNVVHDEGVAESRATFLDAVLSENNDREDLDPIERAIGIETMVEQLGGADAVAAHYGKTKGWVSQQRKLLKLTPELQALVSSGDIPVRVARDIAGLTPEEQGPAWVAEQRQREEAKAFPRVRSAPRAQTGGLEAERFTAVNQQPPPELPEPGPTAEPERFTAVNHEPADSSRVPSLVASDPERDTAPAPADGYTAVYPPTAVPSADEAPPAVAVPDPRPEPDQKGPTRMPWDDPYECARIVIAKMKPAERQQLVERLLEQERIDVTVGLVEARTS